MCEPGELVAALDIARARAIEPTADPERRREHERDCWNAIQAAIADQYPGADMGDLFDDHGAAIVAAMYKAAG